MSKKKERDYLALREPTDIHDLGRIMAERDENLALYYINEEKYVSRALNFEDPAAFFIGPKGIGKSAILQMVRLKRATESNRIIDISPDDLAFSAIANVQANSPIFSEAGKNQWLFKALWDYILVLEIFKREFAGQGALAKFLLSFVQGRHEKMQKL